MSIWSEEEKNIKAENKSLYEYVDEFFENIRGSKFLEYRDGQHTMASSVAEAIEGKELLVVEAGVGIGKSYAYLIPILYAYQNDPKFHGFIVSTSTIALQEQLVRDIENISKILGIEIPVTVAKGKTNYICEKKLNDWFEKNPEEKERYMEILERMDNGDIDRYDFSDIPEEVWNKIHITSCSFDKCSNFSKCSYCLNRKEFTKSNAIICNHDLLIQHLKRESDEGILNNPSVLVIDEAHNLEEKVRTSSKKYLDKRYFEYVLYNIHYRILEVHDDVLIDQDYFDALNGIFSEIRNSAKRYLLKSAKIDSEYEDVIRVSFQVTPKTKALIEKFIVYSNELLKKVESYEFIKKDIINMPEVDYLRNAVLVFQDLLKGDRSNNVFWAEFLGVEGRYVRINYVPKNLQNICSRILSDKNYAKILTSATLTTTYDDYSYYMDQLGLDKLRGISVTAELPLLSPYNYEDNCLVYYASDLPSPKDKESYLEKLSERISSLIKITDGKSLILFTSKKDMQEVYDYLSQQELSFPIYMQQNGNEKEIIDKFSKEENSCLLGTGTFWEGIDIGGSSLSQVIIAKLPFPIVEPVIQSKASIYTDGMGRVYIPEMLIKLKQGVGRLIRSGDDTGVISILDSRMQNYNDRYDDIITDNLPGTEITSDLEKVKEFSKQKILRL